MGSSHFAHCVSLTKAVFHTNAPHVHHDDDHRGCHVPKDDAIPKLPVNLVELYKISTTSKQLQKLHPTFDGWGKFEGIH
jgi:hypothetical protein